MGIFDYFRRSPPASGTVERGPSAHGDEAQFTGFDDPRFYEFIRRGYSSASGQSVTVEQALCNAAVFRALDLISGSIAMLPMGLNEKRPDGALVPANDHPLHNVLAFEPNDFQTPSEFKSQMQLNALVHGTAYALIVRSLGRIIALIPLNPAFVTVEQNRDWTLKFKYQPPDGTPQQIPASDMFRISGLSLNGYQGLARTKVAKEAIGLALAAERSAAKMFTNGVRAGGTLQHPQKLSDEAYNRLKASFNEQYAGVENAGRWIILEEGGQAVPMSYSSAETQNIETRHMGVEEIARVFGTPRPLLMMDDTTWGSGVEQLAILFVRFGLAPWFTAWENGISRWLLTPKERRIYIPDIDERELLRGSMKDQAEYFAKAAGAGGHRPWMTANEIRASVGLGPQPDGDTLYNPMTQPKQGNASHAAA